jgi:hypothetical protein
MTVGSARVTLVSYGTGHNVVNQNPTQRKDDKRQIVKT